MDEKLLNKATEVFLENFRPVAWYGRCIFLSWYCDVGTCKFCYRSTQKGRIKRAENARRSMDSIIVEALLAKHLGWRIEFLTGGYRIFPMDELVEMARTVSEIYGEKIWLNLGALKDDELGRFKPYVKGVVASIEAISSKLHDTICPNKPLEPYFEMLKNAGDLGFKKSATIVIGLGESFDDFKLLCDFINKYELERITFYALKPVKDTPFTEGPETDYYVEWIARTRLEFPKLEIIAGITARRVDDVPLLIRAGANAITKFPATKMFNSEKAKLIENYIYGNGREFVSTLTKLPNLDWDKEVDKLNIDEELKSRVIERLESYLKKMS
ncbi:radical SAM protein [Candidatus Woesearchaeota archaeon]|nr:radical SAM protein [Candidatus Woesearchaeota archaeon]